MEIVIDLLHLGDSINKVRALKKDFNNKVDEVVDKAVTLGCVQARTNFFRAQYQGNNDVNVTSTVKRKKGEIEATGKATLFIEFGTGIKYPDSHPEAGRLGMEHGSWSEGPEGKGHWDDPKGWYFAHGEHTYGNPANRCMYDAGKKIEEQVPRIVREVFK